MYEPIIEPILLWDCNQGKLVRFYNVFVAIVGNKGSVYLKEGPITILNFSQLHEAVRELKERIGFKHIKQANEDQGDEEYFKQSGMI